MTTTQDIADRFLQRIGLGADLDWDLEGIAKLIAKSQLSLPFDNLSVFDSPDTPLGEDFIVDKIIAKGQGGLCYELNSLMHMVLRQKKLAVSLVTATIYEEPKKDWFEFHDTHVLNILEYGGERHLVDIGFGLKSPRVMVPLDGSLVRFQDMAYRLVHEAGFYLFQFRKSGEPNWHTGYRFPDGYRNETVAALERSRKIITFEPASPYNKRPLIAIFTATGSKLLTASSYTRIDDGARSKRSIDRQEFEELAREIAATAG